MCRGITPAMKRSVLIRQSFSTPASYELLGEYLGDGEEGRGG